MGIKQLFQIIKEEAPDAIKEGEIKNQFGRKVAIVGSALLLDLAAYVPANVSHRMRMTFSQINNPTWLLR